MPLSIVFDATTISATGKGASRKTAALLREFSVQAPDWRFTVLVNVLAPHPELPESPNLVYRPVSLDTRLRWCLLDLPKLLHSLDCVGIFFPGESPVCRLPRPYVMSVNEVPSVVRRFSGCPSYPLRTQMSQVITNLLLPGACRNARLVLGISQSTVNDIAREYRVPHKRLRVVYCGCAEIFRPLQASDRKAIQNRWGFPDGYVLVFITGDQRECVETMLSAYAVAARSASQGLLIAGCPPHARPRVRSLLAALSIEERSLILPYVSDQELARLYAGADVYLELSVYEGFGLQVCEAMASGVVVIASNCSSLPEVAGDAAILVDPGDAESAARALCELLSDPDNRRDLGSRAVSQAAQFTWQRSAQATLQALRDAFG